MTFRATCFCSNKNLYGCSKIFRIQHQNFHFKERHDNLVTEQLKVTLLHIKDIFFVLPFLLVLCFFFPQTVTLKSQLFCTAIEFKHSVFVKRLLKLLGNVKMVIVFEIFFNLILSSNGKTVRNWMYVNIKKEYLNLIYLKTRRLADFCLHVLFWRHSCKFLA